MKKILQVNLSGRILFIEEPAYEQLQQYLASLRAHFAKEESREEILNDIEGRIAELLHEILQRGSDRITPVELEDVIASIGRPEDFEETVEASNQSNTSAPHAVVQQKRLYRDTDDKVLGGVCSGIASYLGIDVTIVRLLFAIITLGGFGTGFLIYLALWILLPKRSLRGQSARRLYRNPDDRVLGGVASGLAAYFNVPVRNIRLIFLVPLLINIVLSLLDLYDDSIFVSIGSGSLTGTFTLAYIILWIILPQAATTYQKMEMRGEKVDLDRIKQHVKKGMGQVEERVKGWSEEVEQSAKEFTDKVSERSSEFKSAGKTVLHGIGSVVRFFLYLFLGTIAFALLVSGAAILFAGAVTWPAQEFVWVSTSQQWLFWGMIFFFFIIPFLFLLIFIIRRLFRVNHPAPALRWTFGVLWTIGWVLFFWVAVSLLREFEHKEEYRIELNLPTAAIPMLVVDQSARDYAYSGTWQWIQGDGDGYDITRDTLKIPAVRFKVERSPDSFYHARVVKYAWGRTTEQALSRVDKIQYPVQVRDSVLDVAPGIAVGKEDRYRGQHVELWVQVPVGRSIRFTEPALKHRSWLYRSGTLYTMDPDGHLLGPEGKHTH